MILIFTQVKDLDVQHFQWFCLLDLAEVYYDTPHRVVFLTYRVLEVYIRFFTGRKVIIYKFQMFIHRHCTLFNSGMLVATYDDLGD